MSRERPRPRYLVVHLPAFRLERCGYAAEDLVGLIAEAKSATRLVALTPAAHAAGLALGMTTSQARALVPEIALVPFDADEDRGDRTALLRAFTELSDRVAAPWDDEALHALRTQARHPYRADGLQLVLETAGTAHLFGGEPGLLARAEELAASLGHRSRVAIADDPVAAAALAVFGAQARATTGHTAAALAPLPLAALKMSEPMIAALRAVGIDRVGEWAALDPASVAGRFGEEGARLHRVARGEAASASSLDWSGTATWALEAKVALAGATSTLQLHQVLPQLLDELADHLAARDLAAMRLRLVLHLEQRGERALPPVHLAIRVGRPSRSPSALEPLVRARLEGLRLDAPVDELGLEAVEVAPGCGWQPGLTDRTEATEPLPELLARLEDHLGEDAVFVPAPADSWRPEGAWVAERFGAQRIRPPPPSALALHRGSDDPVEIQRAWEQVLPQPRPVTLLPSPRLVELREERGRPFRIHLDQGWHPIRRAEGPERLAGEWWTDAPFDRSYWAVDLGGRAAWIFAEHGRWYLHGWF